MKGSIQNLNIDGYKCILYLPPEYETGSVKYPVVYINGEDEIQEIMEGVEPHFGEDCETFILLSVLCENWDDEFSPWSAPALKKNEKPFGGGASTYLHCLAETIKKFIDANYHTKQDPENTVLLGYSLGALASIYALYTFQAFGKIGSLSGSLWFEGWTEFMHSNILEHPDAKVYLSLGRGEEHSRNNRMAKVGGCTRDAFEILKQQLKKTEKLKFEWNNGGHFAEIPQRFQKAILWLMKNN